MNARENQTAEWKNIREISKSGRSIMFTAFLVKLLPHHLLIALTRFVTFFYYIPAKEARKVSRDYQNKLITFAKNLPSGFSDINLSKIPKRPHTFRHIVSFSTCLVEKIEGWSGKSGMDAIEFADSGYNSASVDEVRNLLKKHQGCMLFCSHLGNIELFRSILSFGTDDFDRQLPVSIIMDQNVTKNFNQQIASINSKAKMNVISSDDISMATMGQLQETIEAGGLVVISADRVPAHNKDRSLEVSFLGHKAKLPYGPFLINSLLNCPTFFIFSMRKHQKGFNPTYSVHIIKSDVNFDGGRKERDSKIRELAMQYAKLMEKFCLKYPFQWYNFFNFWNED